MLLLKRYCFTLLEMLVVLLILSTGLAITGVKIHQAYQQQQKISEFQQVLHLLVMAQDLMLIMDTDVKVCFSHDPKNKAVTCKLLVEKLLEDGWEKVIKKPLKLKKLRFFTFEGLPTSPLCLNFSMGQMSQGVLTFSSKAHNSSKEDSFKILLKGYPSPITQLKGPTGLQSFSTVNEQLYPFEVYEKIRARS